MTVLRVQNSSLNTIHGNVKIDSNNMVSLCGPSTIDGDVVILNTSPSDIVLGCDFGRGQSGFSIGGSVSITNNNLFGARVGLTIVQNTIGKNMSVTNNLGAGTKQFTNNTVMGNLTCSGNQQPITGQCSQ